MMILSWQFSANNFQTIRRVRMKSHTNVHRLILCLTMFPFLRSICRYAVFLVIDLNNENENIFTKPNTKLCSMQIFRNIKTVWNLHHFDNVFQDIFLIWSITGAASLARSRESENFARATLTPTAPAYYQSPSLIGRARADVAVGVWQFFRPVLIAIIYTTRWKYRQIVAFISL